MRAIRRAVARRPILAGVLLAVVGLLVMAPLARADVWANVGPASSMAGLKGVWTLGHYDLDQQFSMISVGVFSGVDASGVLPMVAYFAATEIWRLTAWLANILIELFGFAFSLDLVNGSAPTNGAGALGPVSRAISTIYSTVLGGPWMVLAVSVTGMWAMWKALVQRRYAETAGQLALSLLYIGIAFLFVLQPAQTIGAASHWTNDLSGAFLSIAKDGEPTSQGEAKAAGADQLFGLLVAQPWAVLEFGGLDHCVRSGSGSEPESVRVGPLAEAAARRLEAGEEVSVGGKTCINNLKKYGPHLLRFEQGSPERAQEVEALLAGDGSKLPDADPGKANGSYKLGPADKPAGAAMEKEGQYERVGIAFLVLVAELGAFFLLGALSVGIITAQILLLLLLAFSPVALIAAAIPGTGHQFFKGWLSKLAGFLLRKAAYSLILAILLTVCAAISAATSELGWLFSFGLQCAFFWAVFLQWRSLTEGLIGIVTGPGAPSRDRALDLIALYSGARLAGGATRPARRAAAGAGRSALWLGGRLVGRGRPGPLGPRRAPVGGVRVNRDLGGDRRREDDRDRAGGDQDADPHKDVRGGDEGEAGG
ncbi:MAG: type IV secretion system protein [Actinobacteria bacterium]|nr:type IV secretion system protein [Actinomycetota bacterium]